MRKLSSNFPMLSVIFVASGKRLPFVERLMDSLISYPQKFLEIITVDNDSCPNVSEWMKKNFPSVVIFRNKENIGTAKAYNIGINVSRGKYLMLINDDCYLKDKVVKKAVDFLELHPKFMGLGLSLLNPNGTSQFTKLHIFSFRPFNPGKPQRITFLGTNNLLCRKEVFQTVGLFDENYFFFNEDLDWSWRAWKSKVKFCYKPEFKIYHGYGLSEKPSFELGRCLTSNIADLYFYRKNLPILFKFMKAFYKGRLKRSLRKVKKIELYPELKTLFNIERSEILNNIYYIQKTLMNGDLTDLLSGVKPLN